MGVLQPNRGYPRAPPSENRRYLADLEHLFFCFFCVIQQTVAPPRWSLAGGSRIRNRENKILSTKLQHVRFRMMYGSLGRI